ncbi:MAG: hypothetical protein MZV70_53645 [Desulfobacterales bacterium]|nr:hypothetical protein [Desulfobacterales bacterium]
MLVASPRSGRARAEGKDIHPAPVEHLVRVHGPILAFPGRRRDLPRLLGRHLEHTAHHVIGHPGYDGAEEAAFVDAAPEDHGRVRRRVHELHTLPSGR